MKKNSPITGHAMIFPEDENQEPALAYFNAPPPKKKYNAHWLVLWQDESEIGASVMEQAKNNNLTLSDYRVRDFLLGTIGIGNYVFVNQSQVSRELNLHKVTVCESIKRLCNFGILIKGPRSGKSNTYMINPAFCFSGSIGNGIRARNETIKNEKAKIINFNKKSDGE